MEDGGRQREDLQKAGSLCGIHGSFRYFDGGSNYFDGRSHQLERKKYFNEEANFKIRETCENYIKTRRRSVTNCEISQRAKRQKSSFSQVWKNITGQSTR